MRYAWLLLSGLTTCCGTLAAQSDISPSLVLQTGHTRTIRSIAFSSDGKLLASGSEDQTVKVWDPVTGRLLRTLTGHTDVVNAVAFRPGSHVLTSGGWDGTLRLWNADSGEMLALSKRSGEIYAMAFSPNGQTIVSAGRAGRISFWDSQKLTLERAVAAPKFVWRLVFAPDGARLISVAADEVDIWDAKSGKILHALKTKDIARDRSAFSLAMAHSGSQVAVGFDRVNTSVASRSLVLLVDVQSGLVIKRLEGSVSSGTESLGALVFDPTDQILFSGRWDGHLLRTRIASSTVEQDIAAFPSMLMSLALSPDGRQIASSGGDPRDANLPILKDRATTESIAIKLWAVSDGTFLRTFSGTSNDATAVSFGASGRLLTVECRDGRVKIWDLNQGLIGRAYDGLPGILGTPTALSPDERFLVTASSNEAMAVWNLQSGAAPVALQGHRSGCINSSAFNRDSSRIVGSDGCGFPGHVRVWDTAGNSILTFASKEPAGLAGAVFNPGGSLIATANTVYWHVDIHDAKSGAYQRTLKEAFNPMMFVDDNTLLARSTRGSVRQWDVSAGTEVRRFNGADNAFSLNSARTVLATSGSGGLIQLFDWKSGMRLKTLDTQTASVASLAFSPDGSLLAAASGDTSVMLWAPDTGRLLVRLFGWKDGNWLTVTPEGLFDGASGALGQVAWRAAKSNAVVPLDAFFTDYYRPGLLAEIVAGGRPKPLVDIATALQVPGLREMLTAKLAHLENHDGSLVVCFEQKPGAVVNAGPADQRVFFPPVDGYGPGTTATCKFEKPIPSSAAEMAQLQNWKPEVITTPWDGKPSETKASTLHVLTMGVSAYPAASGFEALSYAVPSAKAIEGFFRGQTAPYAAVRIWEGLFDSNATRDGLRQRFSEMAKEVKPDDVVLMYMAGHGKVSLGEEMFYFVPFDGMDADLRNTAVNTAQLAEGLRNLKARRIVLIVDACQSGGAIEALSKIGTVKAQVEERRGGHDGAGVHLIAATLPLSYALGLAEGKSVLAETLLKALQQGSGTLTAIELSAFVRDQLPKASESATHGFQQVPLTYSIGLDFPIRAK